MDAVFDKSLHEDVSDRPYFLVLALFAEFEDFVICTYLSFSLSYNSGLLFNGLRYDREESGTFPAIAIHAGGYEVVHVIGAAIGYRMNVVNLKQYGFRRICAAIRTLEAVALKNVKAKLF
jgi:hypothetical protein